MDEIIIRYIEGRASEAEKRQLLEFLRASDDNKAHFSHLRDEYLVSGQLRVRRIENPAYVAEAFRLFRFRIGKEAVRLNSRRLALRIAASVALLLSIGSVAFFVGRRVGADAPRELIVMNRVISTGTGKTPVVLPDSTRVWLNARSELSYPSRFDGGERLVSLMGEGYFEVTPDATKPFRVATTSMTLTVLGTSFNLCSYPEQAWAEATLLTGKVEVAMSGIDEHIIMKPDQKLVFDESSRSFMLEAVNAADYALWKETRLVCRNEPLEVILNKLEHWYGMTINCADNVALSHRLSLTLENESPKEALRLIAMICPIRYTIENNRINITSATSTQTPMKK